MPLAHRLGLKRNKRLLTAALVCAGLLFVNLLFYFAALKPVSGELEARETRYVELRKKHAIAVLFQKQKETFGRLRSGVPGQKDMPLLVKELVQTAKGLKLRVGTINYDIPKPGAGGIAMLSFSFPVTGAYPGLKRFIYEVETSGRLMGIETLELKADRVAVDLQMKLITYVQGQ